jgi:hypothetical protein
MAASRALVLEQLLFFNLKHLKKERCLFVVYMNKARPNRPPLHHSTNKPASRASQHCLLVHTENNRTTNNNNKQPPPKNPTNATRSIKLVAFCQCLFQQANPALYLNKHPSPKQLFGLRTLGIEQQPPGSIKCFFGLQNPLFCSVLCTQRRDPGCAN